MSTRIGPDDQPLAMNAEDRRSIGDRRDQRYATALGGDRPDRPFATPCGEISWNWISLAYS
jgi:hypothetical protein